ncbi:MAG: PEPxxWA-CTERM sorting domain-containing protein [Betaproteobacteria bacterium]|nr:PEPxxWA-CTERM sorting domain-containing protein [Betaproteobacteria bacterium]
MKLTTVTTLALSIAAILGSSSAFAQTRTVTTYPTKDIIISGQDPDTHEYAHRFEFFDNDLNPSGLPFATIETDLWYLAGDYQYAHHVLTIQLDQDSPYDVSVFDFAQSTISYYFGSESLASVLASPQLISTNTSSKTFTVEWGFNGYSSSRITSGSRVTTHTGLTYNLPIPEPETWAMLMAGLGIVGVAARRRRAKAKA